MRRTGAAMRRAASDGAREVEKAEGSKGRGEAVRARERRSLFPDSGPVGIAEGASYSIATLAGLGIATGALVFLVGDLVYEPREVAVYTEAMERVKRDPRAISRLGEPIACWEEQATPRRSRPRINHRFYEEGRLAVEFTAVGSRGIGVVRVDSSLPQKGSFTLFQPKAPTITAIELDVLRPSPGRVPIDHRHHLGE